MKLGYNVYFDDEDGSLIAEKFFINGEECPEDAYDEMMEQFENANEEECEGIEICDCPDCESKNYLQIVTDTINDVFEMVSNPDACNDCKFEALMNLVMLGADGALQGCIGRKEE